jgi:hypothetical protein
VSNVVLLYYRASGTCGIEIWGLKRHYDSIRKDCRPDSEAQARSSTFPATQKVDCTFLLYLAALIRTRPARMAMTTTLAQDSIPPATPTHGRSEDTSIEPTDGSANAMQPFDTMEDETNAVEAEDQYPTGTRFWFPVISGALILLVVGLDGSILATAVPAITDHFHTVADIGW